ncbi:hypothetical protein G7Y79_00014g037140 [Physcia stellaris]|nr:hypothetical protein G7Y79_00014g037140 [Physcia stellaris]
MDPSAALGSLANLRRREYDSQLIHVVQGESSKELGICPSRLWALAMGRGSDYSDMLVFLDDLAKQKSNSAISRHAHDNCTEDLCIPAYNDTTTTCQLHKCQSDDCGIFEFPIEKLNKAFCGLDRPIKWIPTSWDILAWQQDRTMRLCSSNEDFIAISHVWSDGTGHGFQSPGSVNNCLVEYWAEIAKSLQCSGLWWDTLCVPTEKQSKRKALDIMLENYSRAKYVVVHDQELVNMLWVDGKTAAVALVLSTWFTRGWTAAELNATRERRRRRTPKVKVLFKNPDNPMQPLIKDLDRDILAGRSQFTSLAHLTASRILRSVRTQIDSLEVLLQVLQPRSTAWDKDKLIVASLMTLDQREVDTSRSTPELTRAILAANLSIPKTAFFHNKVPMKSHGAWSWCPPSIFDFDMRRATFEADECHEPLSIREDGSLVGAFAIFPLQQKDFDFICPYSSHPSIVHRMVNAAEASEKCAVLKVSGQTEDSRVAQGILVEVDGFFNNTIQCRYISCVYLTLPQQNQNRVRKCAMGLDVDGKDSTQVARDAEHALAATVEWKYRKGPIARFR